jgi:hypothetical protein
MPHQPSDLEMTHQLSEILAQVSALSERVTHLEAQLSLVADIDRYHRLQELLAAGNFKEADCETVKVLLDAAGQTSKETLTPEDIQNFPCSTLRIIDRLWRKYTQGRFGFSVQLRIYQQLGGDLNSLMRQDLQPIVNLGEQIGWHKNNQWRTDSYEQWDFTLSAPEGCFPAIWWKSPYGLKMVTYFFTRLMTCEL